jgi:hypothetical protein
MKKHLIALLAIVATLFTAPLPAQTAIGAIATSQINSTYYVGSVEGFNTNIQLTVAIACAAGGNRVVSIPAGYTGSDLVSGVTGGCTSAYIKDERAVPNACYTWSGSVYASTGCAAASVSPVGDNAVQGSNAAGTALGATNPTSSLNGLPIFDYTNVSRPQLESFLQGLHNCANTDGQSPSPVTSCNLVILGDSFSICDQTNCGLGPTLSTNRWAEQLRIALQQKYGSHGTGIIPVNVGVISGPGNIINPEAWSCSGTFDFNTSALGVGPSQGFEPINGLIHLADGASCRFSDSRGISWGNPIGGNFILYCATTATSGSLLVNVDSGLVKATACQTETSSTTAIQFPLAVPIASGAHSVTITSTGDTYIYGAEGTSGNNGISVHNLAISGASSVMFDSSAKLAFANLIGSGTGGVQGVIVNLMTNDVNLGTGFPTYPNNMEATFSAVDAFTAAPVVPSILNMIPPVTNLYASGAQIPYTAAEISMCQTLSIACVNIQNRWGTTYSDANGLWDAVGNHPGDKGALDEYSSAYSALENPMPSNDQLIIPFSIATSFGPTSQIVGTLGNLRTLTAIGGGFTAIVPVAVTTTGTISSIDAQVFNGTGGTLFIGIFNEVSGQFALASSFTVTTRTSGSFPQIQQFTGGVDFTAPTITAGQFIGFHYPGTGGTDTIGLDETAPSSSSYLVANVTPSSTPETYNDFTGNILGLQANVTSGTPPTTNTVRLPGMTSNGHCNALNPTNSSAATEQSTSYAYVSSVAQNQITITNGAVGGMSYSGMCSNY